MIRWHPLGIAVLTALACVLGLMLVAQAHSDTPIQRAQRVAIKVWGHPPCKVRVVQRHLPGRTLGRATTGRRGLEVVRCLIELDRGRRWSWPMLCSVIVHEWGHVTGHGHNPYPGSIMYPYLRRPYKVCR